MIACVIPMKDGHVLRPEVYKSLAMQSVPLAIMPITRPPLEEDLKVEDNKSFYFSQASNRNIARELILKKYKSKYILYHCSDVVLGSFDVIEICMGILDRDDGMGAVYINTNPDPIHESMSEIQHLDLSSVLIRKEALELIKFRSEDVRSCNCIPFMKDILEAKWRVQYVNGAVLGCFTHEYDLEQI